MNAGISYILMNSGIEQSRISKLLFGSIASTPRIVKIAHCIVKAESLLDQRDENPCPTNQQTCSAA